jgi:hypothetical protein
MGERGLIPARLGIAAVAVAALAWPAGAGAHAAYVDAEGDGSPSDQCALDTDPCQTIAEAAPFVEDGLAVYVDDSVNPYGAAVAQGAAENVAIVALDFRAEPGPAGQWVIDGGAGTAVTVPAAHGATINGFQLRGDTSAVTVNGSATISNNTFDDPHAGTAADVFVSGTGPTTIANNVFTGAAAAGDTAIDLATGSGPATLGRNSIRGYDTGLLVGDVTGAVTMSSDLLAGNATGLDMSDDVSVQNATFWDNSGTDITLSNADLTLDSSIVEQDIDDTGGSTCDITFSRGPASNPCDGFQTSAAPMLAPADLHLQAASPMIDAGNPASTNNFRDIDGDLRFLDGNGDGACPVEPDMGADEFVGTQIDCSPPTQPPITPPAQPGDSTPPQTLIDTGPAPRTKSTTASFTFSSNEPGSTFECSLDGDEFASCASPHSLKVKKGPHELQVRARDAAGNPDPSPASHTWTVKKKKQKKKK